MVVEYHPHPKPSRLTYKFIGGRWDGHELSAPAERPHDRVWLKAEGNGAAWATEHFPGADRYRWDGAEPTDERPGLVIFVPDGELVGS